MAEGFRWEGPALRRRREVRGLRAIDVAREMGLSRERVGQIERSAADALRPADVERYVAALARLDVNRSSRNQQQEVSA